MFSHMSREWKTVFCWPAMNVSCGWSKISWDMFCSLITCCSKNVENLRLKWRCGKVIILLAFSLKIIRIDCNVSDYSFRFHGDETCQEMIKLFKMKFIQDTIISELLRLVVLKFRSIPINEAKLHEKFRF
jgi:hypothetical protein